MTVSSSFAAVPRQPTRGFQRPDRAARAVENRAANLLSVECGRLHGSPPLNPALEGRCECCRAAAARDDCNAASQTALLPERPHLFFCRKIVPIRFGNRQPHVIRLFGSEARSALALFGE